MKPIEADGIQSNSCRYFVTGIDTGVGKTVVSAALTLALASEYWKPVQCGDLDHSDSETVRQLCDGRVKVLPEAFRLQTPASPHFAAAKDGTSLSVEKIIERAPDLRGDRKLVVEGAGGLLVPINERQTMADLMVSLQLPVIVVSKFYLGSINHTLLTLEAIRARGATIAGLVFMGDSATEQNKASAGIIADQADVKVLGCVPWLDQPPTCAFVQEIAKEMESWLS